MVPEVARSDRDRVHQDVKIPRHQGCGHHLGKHPKHLWSDVESEGHHGEPEDPHPHLQCQEGAIPGLDGNMPVSVLEIQGGEPSLQLERGTYLSEGQHPESAAGYEPV